MSQFLKLLDYLRNLSAARVKLLGSISLLAMPIGWLFTTLGTDYRIVLILGAVLCIIGFIIATVIMLTNIQRKAATYGQKLDEFELRSRLEAQSKAYWWFSSIVLFLLGLGMFFPQLFEPPTSDTSGFHLMFVWAYTYSLVLPPWLMAWLLPAQGTELSDEL